ncbi:MAG: site-2 protease family protein [Candidatus Bathyarchaeota archaeon]|nr:site-2 protease family protein [Candidatus Bathyarchaeota archaeon]
MKYSFKIGSVWGIPIELHITFILLIGAVFVLFYPDLYFFLLVVFLFVFVVFHELAHSVVARHYGIRVRKIVLYPIGGVSEIEEVPEKPSIEWRLAIAGPLMSFAVGAVLLGLNQIIVVEVPVATLAPSIATAGSLILDLAILNFILGAFNLIPAFPMDGGRVFRALLAERMKFSDATKYAAYIGRLFGIAMVVVGVFYDFWLILIGVFIYIGASEEAEQTIVSTNLAMVRVKDVMQSEAGAVQPETTLAEAVEVMFKARYHDALVEKEGVFQGVVSWDEIMKVKPEERANLTVGQMPLKCIRVFQDESILEAYKVMNREKTDLLPAVDREAPDKVVGVLTSEGVAKAYEKAKSLR